MRHASGLLPRFIGLLLISGVLLYAPGASCAQLTLKPVASGYGVDGGVGNGGVVDGTFTTMVAGDRVIANKYRSLDFKTSSEFRGAYEFALPAALREPGVSVTSAVLSLPVVSAGQTTGGDTLSVYGYVGNGAIDLGDFTFTGAVVGSAAIPSSSGIVPLKVDVTGYVAARAPVGGNVGFVMGVSWWGAWLESSSAARLLVTYTVTPVNHVPAVSVLSPATGITVALSDTVTLQGTATDVEEGDLGAGLVWNSSRDGVLGSGTQVSVATLSAGLHTITAKVTDGGGAVGSASITVRVATGVNAPPQLTILAPADNAQFIAGSTIALSGKAEDPEEGDLSGEIFWKVDGSLPLGKGAVSAVSLAPGTHTLAASVTDSAGAFVEKSINVTVLPSTGSYCSSRGSNATYEWNEAMTFGEYAAASGKNGGYADLTSRTGLRAMVGNTSVLLTPGFSSGSYVEYWSIWIDLNRDMVFSSDELRFSGNGTGLVTGKVTIPAGSVPGPTRMRVSMKYGSAATPCGSFSYGEVEDYTVTIMP